MDHYKPFKEYLEQDDYNDFRTWFKLANENGQGVLFLYEAEKFVGMMTKIAETCIAASEEYTEIDFLKFQNLFIGHLEKTK